MSLCYFEDMKIKYLLSPDDLYAKCDPELLKFSTTEEVSPLNEPIGQERAVEAIRFGLDNKLPRYHIFVVGIPGTGRTSTTLALTKQIAGDEKIPDDILYVKDFTQPDHATVLLLPAGEGKKFATALRNKVKSIYDKIVKLFASEEYHKELKSIRSKYETERVNLIDRLQREAQSKGFTIQRTATGVTLVPVKDGKVMTAEEFVMLPADEREQLERIAAELEDKLDKVKLQLVKLEEEERQKVTELQETRVRTIVRELMATLKERYGVYKKVHEYLDAVEHEFVRNSELFAEKKVSATFIDNFSVNLIVDNSKLKGAPVVLEANPTYYNLFGKIEYEVKDGATRADFRKIKPGSIHKARGGYLIISADSMLRDPFAWNKLKQILRTGEIVIENLEGQIPRAIPMSTLRAEPVPLDTTTIILIGTPMVYELLWSMDEDFRKFFRVKAEFSTEMDRTPENIHKYAQFIRTQVEQLNLLHFTKEAVAKVVEYGSRLAENQRKLSTRFAELVDLITEASYWATKNHKKYVEVDDVELAIKKKRYRVNLTEEKFQELFAEGVFLIDIEGKRIGQVNALSVIELGDYTFGKPVRVTARVGVGKKGIINIEREVELSGPIHSKGVLILGGYLTGKYGYDKDLSLVATLCFEQLYEEIEGDSASSAELYALISSIARIPLRQDIAVTGSVNQIGEIQPVGGLNEKIEGFFELCKRKGLNGQGVIIPRRNLQNLMLSEELRTAVKEGKFHVYAIDHIEEGLEILTGMKAGKLTKTGRYPQGTINYLVDKRLREMAQIMKKTGGE